MTLEEFNKLVPELQEPFKLPKWRVQSAYPKDNPTKCIVVPYIDSRMVQERLDEVVGPASWQNTYEPDSGAASLSILIGGTWITKTDVGTETKVDAKKGKASDGLKRAAVLWGIGRDLYSLGAKSLPYNAKSSHPMDIDQKYTLSTSTALSNYMNKISESEGLLYQLFRLNTNLKNNKEFIELLKKLKEYVK